MKTPTHSPGKHRLQFDVRATGAISGLRLPHLIVQGAQDGPTTAVTAGQHGREVTGIMAAALAFDQLRAEDIRGCIHFFPAVHPIAVRLRSQDYPVEAGRYRKINLSHETNLDRMWGCEDAVDPLLPAITQQLWETCLSPCDQLLDLHSWSEFFCAMAWAHERDGDLLKGTGFPYLTLRTDNPGPSLHTLREHAWTQKKPVVVVELPGQNVVRPDSLSLGLRTVQNFLRQAGHLDTPPTLPARQIVLREGGQRSATEAPASGLWQPLKTIGDTVAAGDVIGHILCLDSFRILASLKAELSGLLLFAGPPIWGEDHREHQIVFAGQTLVRIQEIADTRTPAA